jgi:DNA invertase Pin-like site-specific DNA recombinase
MDSKVQAQHLSRNAIVYVRQSTLMQVEKNRESALRQYDLARQAQELGWRSEQIRVVDEDQAHSACTTEGRSGFHYVLSEVALGRVGIVLAIEASRLARNNADWQRLVLYCSLTDTLLGDQDGIYDPSRLDDRMVLGLKGTMSELEWHTIRKRLHEAIVNKARRGELEMVPPAGFEWCDGGGLQITPDRQVAEALRLVFDKFDDLGSARQVAIWLRGQGIKLPRRDIGKAKPGIRWMDTTSHAVRQILRHPIYAGGYVYGRRRRVRRIEPDGSVRTRDRERGREDWMILIRDHHAGLIDWERFERIQKRLADNKAKPFGSEPGPVREGGALLQGLAYCGLCGRRMAVGYCGTGRRFGHFMCLSSAQERGSEFYCQTLGGRRIEQAVVNLFLETVTPAGVEVGLAALAALQQQQEESARYWRQCVERAEYEAGLARGRYEAVDAANRLVAAELERRWNEALAHVEEVGRETEQRLAGMKRELSEIERERVRQGARDVTKIWRAAATTPRDRKRLLRAVIERVILTAQEHSVKVAVEWKGGAVDELEVHRHRRGEPMLRTDAEVVDLVRRLVGEDGLDDTQIARVLSRQGMHTATGLTFTHLRVKAVRQQYNIVRRVAAKSPCEKLYTAEEAARELEVSSETVHHWLRSGLLRGKQAVPCAPWRIPLDEETRNRLAGNDAPEGWVGLEEAARRLGVCKQSVANWVNAGKLKAVRVARGLRKGWRICVESTGLEKQLDLGLTKESTG